jgi:hypothetical protein
MFGMSVIMTRRGRGSDTAACDAARGPQWQKEAVGIPYDEFMDVDP